MKTLIIYHGPHCNDGFTAAWVTARAMRQQEKEYELYPMNYGKERIEDLMTFLQNNKYSAIYIVDFSLPIGVLERVCNRATSPITILDHHKTAFAEYGYDMEHFRTTSSFTTGMSAGQVLIKLNNAMSGAGICWDYFFPEEDMPALVQYVMDRDLWKFTFSATAPMHMYLNSRDKTIEEWTAICDMLEIDSRHDTILAEGQRLLDSYNTLVENIANTAVPCTMYGENGLMANCEGQYASNVGHILASRSGTYGLTFYEAEGGEDIVCSLRADRGYDVERLARKFGGGGHKAAAGFKISLDSELAKSFETKGKILPFLNRQIRNDPMGLGYFGAPRGTRTHRGIDYLMSVGENVDCPVAGIVTKLGYPYADDMYYRYIQVTDDYGYKHRMFYVDPEVEKGTRVNKGDIIGTLQDVSAKHGIEMLPHVHYEILNMHGTPVAPTYPTEGEIVA